MAQSTTYGSSTRSDGVREVSRDSRNKTSDPATSVSQRLEGAAESIAEQGREVAENVQVMASSARSTIEKSAREQPMTTLAIAAAVGFVVGALWKS